MKIEFKYVNNKLPDNGGLICDVIKYMYNINKPVKLIDAYEGICAGYQTNPDENGNWNAFMDCITYLIAGEGARLYNITDTVTGETAAYVTITQIGRAWYEENKEKFDEGINENHSESQETVEVPEGMSEDDLSKFVDGILAGLGFSEENNEKVDEGQKAVKSREDKAMERLFRDMSMVVDSEEKAEKKDCNDHEEYPCNSFSDLLSLLAMLGASEETEKSEACDNVCGCEKFKKSENSEKSKVCGSTCGGTCHCEKSATSKLDTKEMISDISRLTKEMVADISRQCTLLQLACQDFLVKENIDSADIDSIRDHFRALSESKNKFELAYSVEF